MVGKLHIINWKCQSPILIVQSNIIRQVIYNLTTMQYQLQHQIEMVKVKR